MAPKRKRNASVAPKGLAPGEQLRRSAIPNTTFMTSSPWGWVGTEVLEPAGITPEHCMSACNLSRRNNNPYCPNKFAATIFEGHLLDSPEPPEQPTVNGELDDDIIIISDDEKPSCSKKLCKANPNCLNYLGQDKWEDEDAGETMFLKAAKLGENPSYDSREPDLPVGLRNLGATCYANASLQVWYRDLAFRSGVYQCKPPKDMPEDKYKESPIFQLQVTFAALQEGNKSVFNPSKLVESLQLRTSEQQDAQEFSKLFMSHLDDEFKKQSLSSVKSLVTDQFQGTQVYGTICHACRNRSERVSNFLEIEINFENNSKLEDSITASLLPETLSDDNQYFCSRCEALQDATRYTELRQLPPVLHFSLLRFVYDLKTMERKKSKHSISFPTIVDMNRFVGSKNDREQASAKENKPNLYELRGILLHKGASAYHGHYEAQVNDIENGSWFLFNDETVTKIKSLGDSFSQKSMNGKNAKIGEGDEEEKPSGSQVKKSRVNARKRRRIDDSDDDVIELSLPIWIKRRVTKADCSCRLEGNPNLKPSAKWLERGSTITSKDAYMLIYAKKDSVRDLDISPSPTKRRVPYLPTLPQPPPPPQVMEIIENLNAAHDKVCEVYQTQEDEMKTRFQELRRQVMDIYRAWDAKPSQASVIVSRQALESWLSEHCMEAALSSAGTNTNSEESTPLNPVTLYPNDTKITISEVLCEHQLLDPMKAKDMKRISRLAYDRIMEETGNTFDPLLDASDACGDCVSDLFKEKLYEIEHPRYTKQFDETCNVPEDEIGYWISKRWCRDWRLLKPKMHVASEADPAPDSSEFYCHVSCEHGGLSLNTTSRRKISEEAVALLQQLFPSWKPFSSDTENCAICDAEVHISKEDKREIRRRVEDEKAQLKFLLEQSLDAWTESVVAQPYAVIPSQFVKSWKRWLASSCENTRPETVDNASFLCEHGLLAFDPNCSIDLESTITIIRREEWDVLGTLYPGGPLISLTRQPRTHDEDRHYDHEIAVCDVCQWDETVIIIRLCSSTGSAESKSKAQRKDPITYSRTNGARQSKRLRHIKEHGERRKINVSKLTTLKDIKIMIHEEFSIPTICQRLFHRGRELEDNSATVATLQLFANDLIDLREEEGVVEIDSDSDCKPATKRRREEGQGFGGTLLGATESSSWSSSEERTPLPPLNSDREKPCIACTFSNTFDALTCQICHTLFA
ncbi:hypothetical protein B0H34DRAFT_795175 [Crassisporium funariophilum]|nr:hypothetical protein B0H34DRAFT_795175 [Crassisporium funariophilum]